MVSKVSLEVCLFLPPEAAAAATVRREAESCGVTHPRDVHVQGHLILNSSSTACAFGSRSRKEMKWHLHPTTASPGALPKQ